MVTFSGYKISLSLTFSLLLMGPIRVLLMRNPFDTGKSMEKIMTQDWGAAYADAMLETDFKQLAAKIDSAKQVLQSCLSELNSGPGDDQERGRIEDALRTLDAVRRIELRASA